MTNLFKLMNTTFESPIVPDSRYLIDKLLNPMETAKFHAVCPTCTAYIGKFGEIQNIKHSHICNVELDLSKPGDASLFVLLNPSSQIKDVISIYKDHYEYVLKETVHEPNHLNDVHDGVEYRKFVSSLSEQQRSNYVSGIFNTDGAAKFNSSRNSI